jgi:hypothetical protein
MKPKGNYQVSIDGLMESLVVVGDPPDQYELKALEHAEDIGKRSSQTIKNV